MELSASKYLANDFCGGKRNFLVQKTVKRGVIDKRGENFISSMQLSSEGQSGLA